ncbi:MAG: MFS transporter [Candidatus Rokubacteria bacterium]|nr:MFS transporter [Candidatus Rokubacteria bacterium]
MFAVANPFAAFGVFLPILADTFGWSRGAISLAMSINLMLGAFLGFVIGAVADRRGPRLPLVLTVGLAGAGFALAATVQTLWQLYLYVGVIAGIGFSAFYILATATVSRWFVTGRGLALGLVLMGFNLGLMTGAPIAAFLIEALGWRVALGALGGGFGLLGVLASVIVRFPEGAASPAPASRRGALREVIGDWRLWMFSVSWLLTGCVMLMLQVHIVPFARDRGVELKAAAFALTAYGIGAVVGRVLGGAASDRLGTKPVMWTFYGVQAVALVPLLAQPSQTVVLAVLVLFGIGFAGADTVFARAVPEVFGLKSIGAVFGFLSLGWRGGAALGPAAAGFLHDATGSYAISFGAAPVAVLVSFVLYLLAVRPPRRLSAT